MPKYRFVCDSCGEEIQKTVSSETRQLSCSCGSSMQRQIPTLKSSSTVTELADRERNVKHLTDHRAIIKERSDKYFWSIEIPRLVNSGKYSQETMLENGWIYVDDKDQIHVHTKPPHER